MFRPQPNLYAPKNAVLTSTVPLHRRVLAEALRCAGLRDELERCPDPRAQLALPQVAAAVESFRLGAYLLAGDSLATKAKEVPNDVN